MRQVLICTAVMIFLASCQEQTPRRPLEVRSGSFLKTSAERNKRLLELETAAMTKLVQEDSLNTYQESSSGFMFTYEKRVSEARPPAKPDDLVTLTYNIRTWNEDTIYRRDEIGMLRYKVDKQELFPGLRYSVKLLREGESATFLYPSSLGYGYHGDDARIGPNTPLKCTVEIFKIEPDTKNEN
ncbi:gliding motility-associated peptidyl-prolyl isomerase GldI [Robiginitalea aurantiaca]|uniref:Peptidyl-prolyl cis-trans isomerase n=1 Tax=Robiginitalea aurantiaca TaxID=3056915 RepID=A0ABT7WGV4_9FLAO|nr:gliding motility-associated peptidyl-prolyl isomerase GldI [Robiginitalea aurantiaca]MDM9632049.1 gliding motility-associated peptidyl-prolyl isomerase GldI [Robiginitalea aurantiaca]